MAATHPPGQSQCALTDPLQCWFEAYPRDAIQTGIDFVVLPLLAATTSVVAIWYLATRGRLALPLWAVVFAVGLGLAALLGIAPNWCSKTPGACTNQVDARDLLGAVLGAVAIAGCAATLASLALVLARGHRPR
jgi:hypothetical protein